MINSIYNIEETKSVTTFGVFNETNDLLSAIREVGSGHVILWLYSGIKTLLINDGVITEDLESLEPIKYLVKARIFNSQKEWHIWRAGNCLKGRLREDEKGKSKLEYVESFLPLKSTITNELKENGWNGRNIKIVTRNYIDYQNHQAGFSDMRFVDFKND